MAVLGGTQVLGIISALLVPPWIAGASVLLENLYLQPKRLAKGKQEESIESIPRMPAAIFPSIQQQNNS